jgi:hypothetical protein
MNTKYTEKLPVVFQHKNALDFYTKEKRAVNSAPYIIYSQFFKPS